jgi:alpha-tubulin suppressor-like RCC1 family protein
VIRKLALGSYHAAAVSDEGLVFTWGRGNSGQLGRGNVMNEDVVRQVTSLNGVTITEISCGDSHTCALSQDGDVYTWGAG